MTEPKAVPIRKLAVIVLAAVSLGGCTASMMSPQPDPGEVSDGSTTANLPDVQLNADLLSKLMLAEMSYFRNDAHAAIEIFEEVGFETRDPRIVARASIMAVENSRLDVAANTTDLWVELSPEDSDAWYWRGTVKVITGNHDDASTDFFQAMELAPDQSDMIQQIGRILRLNLSPDVAFDLLSVVLSRFPDNQEGRLFQISFAISAGKSNEETDALLEALEDVIEDTDLQAHAKFNLLRFTNREQEAESFAVRHLRYNSESPKLREAYAQYLSDNGYYREAVDQFEQIESAESLLELGDLHSRANYPDLAYESYLGYRELRPRDQVVLLGLAEIALKQMRYDEAREWINQIRSPRFVFQRISLSAQYIARTDSVEEGISLLEEYRPSDDRERVRLSLSESQVYLDAHRYDQARQTLDEALEILPGNASLLLARSHILAELNQVEPAEADIRAILEQDPDNPAALNSLGYVLADQTDRLTEALELIEKALALKPNDPYVLDSMGWVQFKLGNPDSAIDFLETALDRRDDPVIAAHLGEVYWAIGNQSKARVIWDRALKKSPQDRILKETVERFVN
ncbi:MAG: tetratricopeptide repeat protein [Acidiferrobacterales bacterium]|nr:tetratricopeptide repeat protein [Acidiferrobacterales bacterium]